MDLAVPRSMTSRQDSGLTGGQGSLGEMACALAGCNANVVIMDRDPALADRLKVRLNPVSARP